MVRGRNLGKTFGFRETPQDFEVDMVKEGDEPNIRQVDCKPGELVEAADGHFTTKADPWNPNESSMTVGGLVSLQ
jgi:hypothetical protein